MGLYKTMCASFLAAAFSLGAANTAVHYNSKPVPVKSQQEVMYEECLERCYFDGVEIRMQINQSLFDVGLYNEMNDHTVDSTVKSAVSECESDCLERFVDDSIRFVVNQ